MSNIKFIVSEYGYRKHTKLEKAQSELERLRGLYPEKQFRIYVIKRGYDRRGEPKNKASECPKRPQVVAPLATPAPAAVERPKKIRLSNFKGKLITKDGNP